MKYRNKLEFMVYGDYALFTDPISRMGNEKCSYQIPTHEALKNIMKACYWRPTLLYYIDKVRIMNRIQMESIGQKLIHYDRTGSDLAYNTYLTNVCYQVQAHFEWNENCPQFAHDRDEDKHYQSAIRWIGRGGRKQVFLGASECFAFVVPCRFGEGEGFYDDLDELRFGLMYYGYTYPDEAYSEETKGRKTRHFWQPVMKNGVIQFVRPEKCPVHESCGEMQMKVFEDWKHGAERKGASDGVILEGVSNL